METESHLTQAGQSARSTKPGRQFHWWAFISVTTVLSLVAMSVAGVVLFVMPPGRIPHRTDWRMPCFEEMQSGQVVMEYGTHRRFRQRKKTSGSEVKPRCSPLPAHLPDPPHAESQSSRSDPARAGE